MLSCLILSVVIRLTGLVPRQHIRSRRHLFKVFVLSIVFVVSVVGGNISLRFIPVSFNQAIGATTPFFTALVSLLILYCNFNWFLCATKLSLCILRKKETAEVCAICFLFFSLKKLQKVYITVVPVVIGIVLASNSEPLFHLWGFLACFTATFARALKSVLQGLLLTNENERLDSLNLLLFMSPSALGKSI